MSSATTFYWHDYETFGADPARDRPAQFAGIRTDASLNIVGEPLVVFCRPADDFLPQPQACLVTGITPQRARDEGVREYEFAAAIHGELARPGTCGVGYNSLRFDDEVTRHMLYRNFYDPYAREWQNGNSRWDIIDMMRTASALRPEGIEWPLREDGSPSFKLEDLTEANGIVHARAHDALSDVRATLELAGLVRERQPRLFDYMLKHRDKQSALAQLDVSGMKPVLHISGMFGADRHYAALIAPLGQHPENRNEIICYDLSVDPGPLLELSAEEIRELLYTPSQDLPEGSVRPGLKSVHINRCPVLLTPKMADAATADRLGIDGDTCRRHLATLRRERERDSVGFARKLAAIAARPEREMSDDPDLMLYRGGFFSDADKRTMEEVRAASPEELATRSWAFEDSRLPEMLFRYRARNFVETLGVEERARWEEYRFQRLTDPAAGASICMDEYLAEIEALQAASDFSEQQKDVIEKLLGYADDILA